MAMNYDDLLVTQEYFKKEEKRNPTLTELKVLDMYYNRPADELIFLKRNQHKAIHNYVMNKHKKGEI